MTIALLDGLGPFIESCATAARAVDEDPARTAFAKIERAAYEVGQSWSGSYLGYHSSVYHAGFTRPAGAVFSVQWGLMRTYGDGTVGDWREFKVDDVRAEVLRRASEAEPRPMFESICNNAKTAFEELKHEALGTIDALLSGGADASLAALRVEISQLPHVSTAEIQASTGGSVISSDMRALSDGYRMVPAHQVVAVQIRNARSHCRQATELVRLVRRVDSYLRKKELVRAMTTAAPAKDPLSVFIIYGRNTAASREVEKFLLAVGLRPLTFQEARRKAGAQPSVFEVVKYGVSTAQVVMALFTPDEWAALAPAFRFATDKDFEKARWQARPNVPFEAGLAMGLNPAGTILVTLGSVELPSDIVGLHQFRLGNDAARRHELLLLLKQLGCKVVEEGSHFLDPAKAGDFTVTSSAAPTDPFVA